MTDSRFLTGSLKVIDKSTCLNYTTTNKDTVLTPVFTRRFQKRETAHLHVISGRLPFAVPIAPGPCTRNGSVNKSDLQRHFKGT